MAIKAIKAQATAAATALKLSDIERAVVDAARQGVAGERDAMARDVAALQAAAKDGKACKTYADLFKAAVVAEILGFEANDLGVIRAQGLMTKGAKRDATEKAAILAAANRLSRRVKAAGLEAANAAGKKRGAKLVQGATKAPKASPAPATPATPKASPAPILVNEKEWAAFLSKEAAALRAAQSKNAKSATARVRAAIAAFAKAAAELEKALAA